MTDDNTQAKLATLRSDADDLEMADAILQANDKVEVTQNDAVNAAEYLYREYGLDPHDYDTDEELRKTANEAGSGERDAW